MDIVFTILYVFAMIAMGCSICWLMLRANRNVMTYSFIGCQSTIILWLISELIEEFCVTDMQLIISYNIANLGICFIGPFWLLFSLHYAEKKPPRAFVTLLFCIAGAIYALSITNPFHNHYYAVLTMNDLSYGIGFYINQAFIYLCMLSGLVMIFRQCFTNRLYSRGQAVLLAFGVSIPLVFNLFTLSGIISQGIKLTPLSLGLSSVLVLFATYRYGFLNVNAVAFEDALNSIEEGVVIFNKYGHITYLSNSAKKHLDITPKLEYDNLIENITAWGGKKISENFEYEEISKEGRILSLKGYKCRDDKGRLLARLIIVSDITRYYELIERTNELAAAEQSLAIEQERNRIAQEVHDTAGHTFTMISSLARLSQMEVGKIENNADVSKIKEYLNETESLSRSGITQLRCSINNLRDATFLNSVTGAIKTITDAVRDMQIDFCVQGIEDERYSFCARAIYDSVREIITNCLRYAGADRMDIILKLLEKGLELYIFDNGKGCENISMHDGLKGISKRIEALGGTVVFNSSAGNGFSTIIKIPIGEKAEQITEKEASKVL